MHIMRRDLLKFGAFSALGSMTACAVPTADFTKPSFEALYAALPEEKFAIPAVPRGELNPKFYRQRVRFDSKEKPGTLIVNTNTFYLHLVEPGGTAMRYGVGLGRQGFEWSGRALVEWKRPWPTWTPPQEMIAREPHLKKYSAANGGMEPGLKNPLGARALYIYQDGVDTLYRLHGTPEHKSIGKAASSGCVRLVNQDVIDLYERVKQAHLLLLFSNSAIRFDKTRHSF